MWLEGEGRRQLHTDLGQTWDLTSTFLSLSFPHTLLTFSLPGARSWNVQVSLIYPRKLGLIWNQGTSSLSLSSAEIIGIRHFRYHPQLSLPFLLLLWVPLAFVWPLNREAILFLPDSFTSYAHPATNHMVFSLAVFGVFIYSLIYLTNILIF